MQWDEMHVYILVFRWTEKNSQKNGCECQYIIEISTEKFNKTNWNQALGIDH